MRRRRRVWSGHAACLLAVSLMAGMLGVATAGPAGALGSPTLLSIAVTPAVTSLAEGQTQQFTATGLFSNLTTKNLTDSVTWSSSQGLLASVSNALGSQGLATGLVPGLSTITATDPSALLSGTSALTVLPAVLTAITVTPAVTSLAEGQTQQFTATGLLSNLSTENLTNSVTWSSSQGLLASVSNALGSQGLATGLVPGLSTITATDPSALLSGTSALTVLPAVLTAITVTPAVTSLAEGQTQQFTATGLLSNLSTENLTNSVTWSSSQGLLASVSNALGSQGLATGLVPGLSTITATDPSALLSGTSALTVLPAVLTAITVTPAVTSLAEGQTQQFTATGLLSNLSTENLTNSVTWSSSQGLLASVSNALGSQGLATGLVPGLSTITATDPTSLLSGTSLLTVVPGLLSGITLSPSSGPKKTPVTVSGMGFTAGQTLTVTYLSGSTRPKQASTKMCSATAAGDGTFTCNGRVPRRVPGPVPRARRRWRSRGLPVHR